MGEPGIWDLLAPEEQLVPDAAASQAIRSGPPSRPKETQNVSDDVAFLLYALLFRFGIVGAEIYAMFLGYRLLGDEKAIEGAGVGERAIAEASIPGAKLKIKNVTAGSIFALFGALLIVAMVLQGNPEKTTQKQVSGEGKTETEKLRGDANDSILATIQSGVDAQSRGASEEAEARFHDVLSSPRAALWLLASQREPSIHDFGPDLRGVP